METMHAVVKSAAKAGLSYKEVPVPNYGEDEVLVRVRHASLCGSDVTIHDWKSWARDLVKPPVITGHEFCGHVVAFGERVTGLELGDLVGVESHVVCGRCKQCLTGNPYLCSNYTGIGVSTNGGFAEYVSVPARNIWKAEPSISPEVLSCFDPFGNAVHAAMEFDLRGKDVFITGAGPIGVMAAAVAAHVGARTVIVSDPMPFRLNMATNMGATAVLNPLHESVESVRRRFGIKEGFEVGLEMSGNEEAFQSLIRNMGNGGKVSLLGVVPKNSAIDWQRVIFSGLQIHGIFGRKIFETWFQMSRLMESGLDITPVITHRYLVSEIDKAIELMRSGKCGKIILSWADQT